MHWWGYTTEVDSFCKNKFKNTPQAESKEGTFVSVKFEKETEDRY